MRNRYYGICIQIQQQYVARLVDPFNGSVSRILGCDGSSICRRTYAHLLNAIFFGIVRVVVDLHIYYAKHNPVSI